MSLVISGSPRTYLGGNSGFWVPCGTYWGPSLLFPLAWVVGKHGRRTTMNGALVPKKVPEAVQHPESVAVLLMLFKVMVTVPSPHAPLSIENAFSPGACRQFAGYGY